MIRLLFSLIIISLATTSQLSAQTVSDTVGNLPGVEIVTSVDRTESYVGDMINYTVTITYDSTYRLTPPPLGANLGAFEVKGYEPDQETELDDGRIQSLTRFVLSTYTTGDYIIPALPVVFMLPDSTIKIMISESLPITILSLLGDGADSLSLKGPGAIESLKKNKPPFEFKRDYTWHYIWGGLGLLALLGLAYFWYWRKHRKTVDADFDPREPWEIALEKLAILKERRYVENESFKLYYIELTELAREFAGRVYKLDSLEMTTEEFVKTFDELIKPIELFEQTVAFMRQADLVKFAKFVPEVERTETDYLFVHGFISDIRDACLRQAEAERLALAAKQKSNPKTKEVENV